MLDQEFNSWFEFHKQSPLDDVGQIFKPAALIYSAQFQLESRESAYTSALDMLAPKPKKPTRLPRCARTVKGTP